MWNYIQLFTLLFISVCPAFGQEHIPVNGVATSQSIYALTNAKIVVSPDETIERGTIIIQNGRILAAGLAVLPPKNAVKINLKGYTIYPSFIDPYITEGFEKRKTNTSRKPQFYTLKQGPYYWNEAMHPEFDSYSHFQPTLLTSKKDLIAAGFGIVSTHEADGILRGTATCVSLDDQLQFEKFIRLRAAQHYSFSKGTSKQSYPTSQMGAIALIKQFYLDAAWYDAQNDTKSKNKSLSAGIENLSLPQIFHASDKLEVLRAASLANSFGQKAIVKTGGDDYERISEIKASGAELILPLNFPKAFDVTDPYLSRFISLADLKDWEMRRYNPYIVSKNHIPFSFTTDGLKDKKEFLKQVKLAVKHGLSKTAALRALTIQPATCLTIDGQAGTLAEGKWANLLIVKGDIFEHGEIYENWIRGERHRLKNIDEVEVRGDFNLNINSYNYLLKVTGEIDKPKATIIRIDDKTSALGVVKKDSVKIPAEFQLDGVQVSFTFLEEKGHYDGVVQVNGTFSQNIGAYHGKAHLPNGAWVDWSAIKNKDYNSKAKEPIKVDTSAIDNTFFPNMAFGFDSLPSRGSYFIKNATLWTNEAEGIVKNATLLIKDGKIAAVNKSIVQYPNNTIVIDAKGKHVTAGIIDEHSHIAISKGVNEAGQANSSEVSIQDVVRSNDINIYRQLSGGVTTSQLLHGSANPIGGQSAIIKLKWGFAPSEMLLKNSPKFIKFALGENVKQSNWGDHNTTRFPQTRMGVEQVYYDAFIRARAYEKEWKAYNALSQKKQALAKAPRKDLALDALVEILNGERYITCHSYIQSEINMLMHVADSMGFTVNTFTHILEGYKVADKMKVHGAGASTFADWWAYKFEVNDAIPYNASILNEMGIVTAINSDDAEMGRRLNQEAAKVVKYGGVSEEDAWKMVTLNPAKLLHIDERVGSLKVGKDADVVIWSDHPLSIQAKVEQTFVDGYLLYDLNRSVLLHQRDLLERNRIMKLMLEEKKKGADLRMPTKKTNVHYHCDTVEY
jgi:imidazolonepropionase-like amidohydrolase